MAQRRILYAARMTLASACRLSADSRCGGCAGWLPLASEGTYHLHNVSYAAQADRSSVTPATFWFHGCFERELGYTPFISDGRSVSLTTHFGQL